ncbi:hypothetical protein FDH01_gp315 [Acinetobacter phage vB_AbaM_ME3]|uniref:Uncharacterized protein n=1 Tax=Acinetobacter phage vB_AbaM_ME3 TaxID=1837876 RepID=A0A172Q0D4_9CAUD|nr:hypothetical protein FDH01_gp315 [Acinetobacter phage vB_AbaM_ME3]AND75307.1 hypothetical protein ME3_146 [Acinetobacter phage vB_AbaM_ME3]
MIVILKAGVSLECSQIKENVEYEVIAKDIKVFETFYKLKDVEGWYNGKYFKQVSTDEEDPEPFSEF